MSVVVRSSDVLARPRMFFLADNLVVEFQADVAVFVPSGLAQAVAVELFEPFHFVGHEVLNELFTFVGHARLGQIAHEYHVVAHARHNLHAFVGQDVDLLHQVAPQVVLHERLAEIAQIVLGVVLASSWA